MMIGDDSMAGSLFERLLIYRGMTITIGVASPRADLGVASTNVLQ